MERRKPTVATEKIDRTLGWKAHQELLRIIEEKKGGGAVEQCARQHTCCLLNERPAKVR